MNPLMERRARGEVITLRDKAETMESEAEVQGWLAEARRNGDADAIDAGLHRLKQLGARR
ncbi:hypothetical protein [Celeribacter sp.]|uniref:hypothetical protein n=1 Tax=Celeribacter sp. TaxID=1890673 RepID=UPI003A8EC00E